MLPEAAINDQYLNPLLHSLVEGLTAEARVAANVCWVSEIVTGHSPVSIQALNIKITGLLKSM